MSSLILDVDSCFVMRTIIGRWLFQRSVNKSQILKLVGKYTNLLLLKNYKKRTNLAKQHFQSTVGSVKRACIHLV